MGVEETGEVGREVGLGSEARQYARGLLDV
jgi:hypothetical protein